MDQVGNETEDPVYAISALQEPDTGAQLPSRVFKTVVFVSSSLLAFVLEHSIVRDKLRDIFKSKSDVSTALGTKPEEGRWCEKRKHVTVKDSGIRNRTIVVYDTNRKIRH